MGSIVMIPFWWSPAQTEDKGSVRVEVDGLVEIRGMVRFALFNSPAGFPDDLQKALLHLNVKPDGSHIVVRFPDLPYGAYAVTVHHDLNDNKKLDKNIFGFAAEPIAFSNHVRYRFRAPTFEAAAFSLKEEELTVPVDLSEKKSEK